MVRSSDGDIIEITKYRCSPLLVVMEETGIPVDSEDGAILLDFPTSTIHGYIEFLDGQGVDMTLELKAIIDYMGHDNKLGYPDEFWQLKKKCGMVKIPVRNRVSDDLHGKIILGGEMAMYMGGYIDSHNEVDVFPLEEPVRGYPVIPNSRNYKYHIHEKVHSLDEVIHRYDLPCLGVAYDGHDLWSTELALWCNKNMTIWVEPDKMSMAYIAQLYKCMKKGYSIKIPYIGLIDIDEDKTKDILIAMTMASRFSDSGWSILGPITDPMKLPRPISRIRTYTELCDNERLVTECMRRMDRRRIRYNEQVERGIPINHDLPVGEGYIEYIPYENDLSVNFLMLIFYGICINPCSKDTSREEIDDFLEWMKSSPIAK